MTSAIVAGIHYIAIMTMTGSLFTEYSLLKSGSLRENIKRITVIDLIFGISALVVLATGLLRWFVYGKGADYYLSNYLFHTKLTLFVLLGVLSVVPTIRFLGWRKKYYADDSFEPELKYRKRVMMFIHIEMVILVIIPLLAAMIARGMGVIGH
ncbi:MAG: DUF2214 family protein [Bacteroidales bacterium]